MAFSKTFPYNTGTFVVIDHGKVDINRPETFYGRLGTISCYQYVDEENDGFVVMVSGYKDSWCGEYLLDQIRLATDEELNIYKQLMGII